MNHSRPLIGQYQKCDAVIRYTTCSMEIKYERGIISGLRSGHVTTEIFISTCTKLGAEFYVKRFRICNQRNINASIVTRLSLFNAIDGLRRKKGRRQLHTHLVASILKRMALYGRDPYVKFLYIQS